MESFLTCFNASFLIDKNFTFKTMSSKLGFKKTAHKYTYMYNLFIFILLNH